MKIKATRNGKERMFDEMVWALMPKAKFGWQAVIEAEAIAPPAEVVAKVKAAGDKAPKPAAEVVVEAPVETPAVVGEAPEAPEVVPTPAKAKAAKASAVVESTANDYAALVIEAKELEAADKGAEALEKYKQAAAVSTNAWIEGKINALANV